MNPLVILSGGKDALLARETFVTDLYIYIGGGGGRKSNNVVTSQWQ